MTQGNKEMAAGLALASYPQTSALASTFVSALLSSPKLPDLLSLNSRRLAEGYSTVTNLLKKHHLEYVPSYAGLYVFAKIVPNAGSWDEESRLVNKLKDEGVLVSAGKSFHGPEQEKGWARIGFAVPKQQLDDAVRVMDRVFEDEATLRKQTEDISNQKPPNFRVNSALDHLIGTLREVLDVFKGDGKEELLAALHDHEKLPDKQLASLANKTIDLLHETEQLLEPGSLVLADHFLGIFAQRD